MECEICKCSKDDTVKMYSNKSKFKMTLCNKHYCQMNQKGEITDKSKSRRDEEYRKCDICGSKDSVQQYTKSGEYNGFLLCVKHKNQIRTYGKVLKRTKFDKNEIVINGNFAEVILYNIKNEENARTLISVEDINKVEKYKWHLGKNGYATTDLPKVDTKFYLHHLILENGAENKLHVDHINRNKLDNRRHNLRLVEFGVNAVNKGLNSRNTSGVIGVSFYNNKGKWYSKLGFNNKDVCLGAYDKFEDAVKSRLLAELKYYPDCPPQAHLFEQYNIRKEELV